MIYFPNYILELLFFFFSTFYSIYLLLKLKSEKNKNFNISFFFFNFISINFIFFCFFLSSSSIIDTIFQSIGNTADLPITKFFYFSLLNFFIFFLFLKSTRFKNYLRNSQFLYSIIFFFFFCFFLVLTASSLDSLILFEFLTLCVLLYMAASSTTAGVSTGSATSNVGVNIKFNSISYVSNSFLNFFFFMFIFGVLFFFFFFFFFFIYNFNFNFFLKAAPAVQFVIVINILFIVLNTNTVFDIKHFIILSTLINSSFFLLSIFLYKELSVFYFFLFFFNYLITSFSILIYLYFYSKDFKNISNLKKKNNIYVSNFFFFIPVLSLSGVAPTVGFLSKFLFVINVWSLNYLFIALLIVFSIVFSTIFYFQVFKNYFFFKRATFRDFFFKKKYGYETPTPAASALAVFFSIFIILVWFFFFIIIFELLVF